MAYSLVIYKIVYFEIETTILYYHNLAPQLGLIFEKAIQHALDQIEEKPQYFLIWKIVFIAES